MNLTELIHFKYVGGGYFRDTRIPKGETAPMLHGEELIKIIKKHINPEPIKELVDK